MVNFQETDCSTNYQMDNNDIGFLDNIATFVSKANIWFETCGDNDSNVLAQDCLQHDSIAKLYSLYNSLRINLSVQSWIQYMQYIELLKTFLLAERTSNWLLHLDCLHRMLGLFAATGHNNCAKSVRVYLEFMNKLPESYPSVYNQFLNGMHTIRLSDRFWAGLSCDLVIEQTLMRSIKSRGGLTHGRGVQDTLRSVWLKTMAECAKIRMSMSHFLGFDRVNDEHKDVSKARTARDATDVHKLTNFLNLNSPFRFTDDLRLVSLSSGVSAGPDDGVNCDTAETIGYEIQQSWDGEKYSEVTLRKASLIKTLANMHNLYKLDEENSSMDANSLFHRLVVLAQSSDDVASCFTYELTPYPTALFKDGFMRKPNKATLYKDFCKDLTSASLPSDKVFVADGGCLLHRVKWQKGSTGYDVMRMYVKYVIQRDSVSLLWSCLTAMAVVQTSKIMNICDVWEKSQE